MRDMKLLMQDKKECTKALDSLHKISGYLEWDATILPSKSLMDAIDNYILELTKHIGRIDDEIFDIANKGE